MSRNIRKKEKFQASIEYLSTFSIALLIILIILAVVGLNLFGNNSAQNFATSSCYLSAELQCSQIAISNNGVATSAIIIFTNNLGRQINFENSNSIMVTSSTTQKSYFGNCYPANAVPGATVVCNATLAGYSPSVGEQLSPTFQLKYSECINGQCSNYNTSGSGITYVSPKIILYRVRLLTSPDGGTVSVNGVPYLSNSILYFVGDISYSIAAQPSYSGTSFQGWITQGGVSASNTLRLSSSAIAASNGTLEASYILPQSTTTQQSTSTLQSTTLQSTTLLSSSTSLYSSSSSTSLYSTSSSTTLYSTSSSTTLYSSSTTLYPSSTTLYSSSTTQYSSSTTTTSYDVYFVGSPSAGGTPTDASGQTTCIEPAGGICGMHANTNAGYTFSDWTCSGGACSSAGYCGTCSTTSATIYGTLTLTAHYTSSGGTTTVSGCSNSGVIYGTNKCNGVYYGYCSSIGTSYIYESGAANDGCTGSKPNLCHTCGATDDLGNTEGTSSDDGDGCDSWAC